MEGIEEPKTAEEKATVNEESNIYDEAQDYLARAVFPAGSTKQDKCIIRKRAKRFKLIEKMVMCDGCHEWYYEQCEVILVGAWTNPDLKWYCGLCKLNV